MKNTNKMKQELLNNSRKHNFCVYVHTCPNGKKYVGRSRKPIERWGYKGGGYHGQPFYKAIEKYGWDNIQHEIIATKLTVKQANELERDTIKKLDTIANGYNVAKGGTKEVMSEEVGKKISEANSGSLNWRAEEVLCAEEGRVFGTIRECAKHYEIPHRKLAKILEGTYKSLDETPLHFCKRTVSGNWSEPMPKPNLKVVCIETGEKFPSASACARHYGLSKKSVIRVVSGERKRIMNCDLHFARIGA